MGVYVCINVVIMVNSACCVHGCVSSSRVYKYLTFYKLPKDRQRRKKWKRLSKTTRDDDSKWTTICRLHFKDGWKSDFYSEPTIFPWSTEWQEVVLNYNNYVEDKFKALQGENMDHNYAAAPKMMGVPAAFMKKKFERTSNTSKRALRKIEYCESEEEEKQETPTGIFSPSPPPSIQPPQDTSSVDNSDLDVSTMKVAYYTDTYLLTRSELQSILTIIEEHLDKDVNDINLLKKLLKITITLLKNVQEQLDTVIELRDWDRFLLRRFEGSDDDIKFWTGFPSYDSLMYFFNGFIVPNQGNMKYWGANNSTMNREFKTGIARQLTPVDELFLTLVKLKRASANEDLSERFKISSSHVSSIFITWINLMAKTLRKIDVWLSRRKVKKMMPDVFKPLYSDVRIIVDFTEMEIERPSDFELQSTTYSAYKSRNTVKGLIGLSPTGLTTFVSPLMEGSISDNDITAQSGLLEKLEKGDAIMADRGWTNKSALLKHGIRLAVPEFLMDKKQFLLPDLVRSVSIARLRIHVERSIGRVKQWNIINNRIPLTHWNNLNDIWFVCASLPLFWPPIIDVEDT